MLTNQSRSALVSLLKALSPGAITLLLIKHLDRDLDQDIDTLLAYTSGVPEERMVDLLLELLTDRSSIRTDAPTKYVFDKRLEELRRCLRADGYEVIDNSLTRLNPAAESVAQISDELDRVLSNSNLDADSKVRQLLRESHENIGAVPPDFNGATTKARIALETIARRSASIIANNRTKTPPSDTWGAALSFLRAEGVIRLPEEEAIAMVYTLISPGAHIPKGLTDQQWALLARTFAISGAYFLTRQHLAA